MKNTGAVASDLATLLKDPAQAEQLPLETIGPLLAALAALEGALAARLLRQPMGGDTGARAREVESRLLTVAEVARLLRVPNGYAYELARRGEIPTVRIGKYVRVSASALREWTDRRQEKGPDNGIASTYTKRHRNVSTTLRHRRLAFTVAPRG